MKKLIALLLLSPLIHAEFIVSDKIVLVGMKGADETPAIYDCKNSSDCLYFHGEITEGDYIEFEKNLISKIKNYYLDSHNKFSQNLEHLLNNPYDYDLSKYKRFTSFKLLINSAGGNVSEALKMAKLIRELELHVLLPMDAKCFSACFYLYSAGVTRTSSSDESIGIHSPSFEKKFFNKLSQEEANLIYKGREAEAYDALRDFNIPEKFISKMKSVPSQDLHFLSYSDISELSFDRIYKERLISFDVNTTLSSESRTFVDNFELALTMRMLQLKNLSNRFPDLIKKKSLHDIIKNTAFWNAYIFGLSGPLYGLDSNMSNEEKLLYIAENNPKEFMALNSAILGVQQANWYEAIANFDRTFPYKTIPEDLFEKGLLEPEVETLKDAKAFLLASALTKSFIPFDEL